MLFAQLKGARRPLLRVVYVVQLDKRNVVSSDIEQHQFLVEYILRELERQCKHLVHKFKQ
jgi:hypothetical protein